MTDYLIRMMAPVLSFLAEESYDYFKGKSTESVFLLDFPVAPTSWKNPQLAADFEKLLQVRSGTQKILEGLRSEKKIGASLEAAVSLSAEGDLLNTLQGFQDLRELLIVSQVEIKNGPYSVSATKASGEKCVRCWTYSEKIGLDPRFAGVCPKCTEALS
jgi:isoleucyl-tRNA synthetase